MNLRPRKIKISVGKVHLDVEDLELEIRGRDAVTGLPRTEKVTSSDVYKMIRPTVDNIVARIKLVLEKTPPELSADIVQHGIVLTGGGALLRGIDKAIEEEIGVPCPVAEDHFCASQKVRVYYSKMKVC